MNDYGSLIARICLSFVFLWSGFSKLAHPKQGVQEVAALGLPLAPLFLVMTLVCQIAGGLMVLLGFWTRLGAVALLGFTGVATALAHRATDLSGAKRQEQLTISFEHLAIVGGFLLLIVHGGGLLSIDALLR